MCHRVGHFPHHTSWKTQKYLIKLELMKLRNNSLHLNVADIEREELCIARHVQHSTYGTMYRELSADTEDCQQAVSKVTNVQLKLELKRLSALCPFLDSLGVLRMRGRLSKLDINYDRQHQIILPKRHQFTNLVVQHYHEKTCHSGPEATLGTTHQKNGLYRVVTS